MKHIIGVSIIGLMFVMSSYAQEKQTTIPTAGGEAVGTGGSMSYTIGQVFNTSESNEQYILNQGIQQSYEIYLISSVEEANAIELTAIVFPNPTTDILYLKIQNYPVERLSCYLYDMDGRQILNQSLVEIDNHIDVSNLTHGTYLLKLKDGAQEVKIFKIIKH